MKVCPICHKHYHTGSACPEDGATLVVENVKDPLVGTIIKDNYRIDSLLGEGGMSKVYLATQLTLKRKVALKVVRSDMQSTKEFIQLFLREARTASQINHPNVISVIDFGNTAEGMTYLVTEFLAGKELDETMGEEKGMSKQGILALMKQICSGLSAAHQQGIVHRDLKPSNIMIAKLSDGTKAVKILDFGISKPLMEQESEYTRAGMVMGTPGYLSPEQILGSREIDTRADIYSMGALLYYLVSGRKPFQGQTQEIVMHRQTKEAPDPIAASDVKDPKTLCFVPAIHKAMAIEPDKRYPDIRMFFNDLLRLAKKGVDPAASEPDKTVLAPTLPFAKKAEEPTRASPALAGTGPVPQAPVEPPQKPSGKKFTKWLAGSVAFVCIALAAALFLHPPWQERIKDLWVDITAGGINERGVHSDRLLLGMSAPFKGPAREIGRAMHIGIEARIQEVNAQGGIHSRLIELQALDDAYNPDLTVTNVDGFIDPENGVFAMLGNVGTANARAVLPHVLESKLLLFGAFSGAEVLRKEPPDRYVFNYRASYAEETAAIIEHFVEVRKLNPEHIAVFTQFDEHGSDSLEGVKRALRKYGVDAEDIVIAEYPRNSSQVDGAVQTVMENRPKIEGIVLVGTPTASALFAVKLKKAGFAPLMASISFVGSKALADNFQALGPEFGDGLLISQVVPMVNSYASIVLKYREALERYFPSEEPGFISLEGYIAATILLEAIAQTGRQLTTEKLVDRLHQITNQDIGIGDNITFGPSDHQAVDRVWMTQLHANGDITELR